MHEKLLLDQPDRSKQTAFSDALDVKGAQEYLDDDSSWGRRKRVIDFYLDTIRNYFTYQPTTAKKGIEAHPIQRAEQQHVTDCFGYTYLFSELLSLTNIDHRIVFANDHVFVITSDDDQQTVLIDPLNPAFDGVVDMPYDFNAENSAVELCALSSTALASNAMRNRREGIEELSSKFSWLNRKDTTLMYSYGSKLGISRKKEQANRRLILSIFSPEAGRQMLDDYSSYSVAVRNQDYSSVLVNFVKLGKNYPNRDAYQSKNIIIRAIQQSLQNQEYLLAYEAALSLDLLLSDSTDPRDIQTRAKALEKIASYNKNKELLQQSLGLYEQALMGTKSRGFKEKCQGAIDRIQQLLAEN